MVYVVQEVPGRNVLPATRFGDLKVLLPPGQVQVDATWWVKLLQKGLSEFADGDYLLCIGDPAAIGLATAVAASKNQGRVALLKWDRQERVYYPITANIKEKAR